MNKNWEVKKLGEVCEIERGGSPRPIQSFLTDSPDGINWIKIGDTKGITKYIYQTKEKIKPEGASRSRIVNDGDFILSNSMSFGRPYIMKTTGCIHDGWLVLREKEPNIDKNFLYYLLSSDLIYKQFDNLAAGSTVRNLNIDLVKSVQIPIFPLPEQQRIVSILDETFAAIDKAKENAEKNLQNSRELFESYLQSVFANPGDGWKENTLKQVATTFGRGKSKHRPRNDKELYGGKYPFIQTGDIRNSNHYVTEYSQTYNEIGLTQSKLWPKGTICITIAANIAETGILSFDACFPDSIIGLVVNPKLADTNFVEYLLQSFKTRLQRKGKGSAQDNINLGTFENELFPIPPLSEQHSIVAKLEALSTETKRLEVIYQQKLAALDELKKSVLQKAFNGELAGA
jgi:type I restriction enzyme S subunit